MRRGQEPGWDEQNQAGKDLGYLTVLPVSLGFTPRAWEPRAECQVDWKVWEEVCKVIEHKVNKQGLLVQVTGV